MKVDRVGGVVREERGAAREARLLHSCIERTLEGDIICNILLTVQVRTDGVSFVVSVEYLV